MRTQRYGRPDFKAVSVEEAGAEAAHKKTM